MQAPPIRNSRRDMPTLVVANLLLASSPFVGFKSQVGKRKSGFHRRETRYLPLSGYRLAFEKINGLDAVFFEERYSIYQHLSAKGMITIGKACYLGVRFIKCSIRSAGPRPWDRGSESPEVFLFRPGCLRILPYYCPCGQSGDYPVRQIYQQQVDCEHRPALLKPEIPGAAHRQEDDKQRQHRREEV